MLIQYAETLPPLPDWLQGKRLAMDPVPECMSPVFLHGEKQTDGGIVFYFDIPPEAPTVRGLASILYHGLNGATPDEILSVPMDFYLQMNLQEAISYQRLRGFMGLLAHMKQAALN